MLAFMFTLTTNLCQPAPMSMEVRQDASGGMQLKFRRIQNIVRVGKSWVNLMAPFLAIEMRIKCDTWLILNTTIIIIMSQIAIWKNGIRHQMTSYCVVIVAGEQMQVLRLYVHHVKSIIVYSAQRHLTCATDRPIVAKSQRLEIGKFCLVFEGG